MRDRSVTRREFAQRLTAGTSVALGSWAAANGEDQSIQPDDPPKQQDARPDPDPDVPPPEPEDLQLAALIQQYPAEHLTGEMLAGIRANLRRHRRQGEQLRTVELSNSDEPATILRAWSQE